tara:strand:- start:2670 stop:2831 length:162 start_codon:yes stop_codon:yes gene_type:complete
MNNLKISITLSLVFLSILRSSQAFAENIKVNIGKIADDKELIIFDDFEDISKA